MATPAAPPGEPLSEALSEAAQAAAMSVRLILTIADAVRRAAQKHHQGKEKELGPDAEELAEGWSTEQLRTVLPEGILNGLMAGADWPLMARHLASLQQAGVDLTTFLPNLGRMASAVEQAVARNTARIQAEGTDRWADLLRATMPEGLVRDAILASPAWPDIASRMGRLHEQGAGLRESVSWTSSSECQWRSFSDLVVGTDRWCSPVADVSDEWPGHSHVDCYSGCSVCAGQRRESHAVEASSRLCGSAVSSRQPAKCGR
ncbi:hypothetical protein AB0L39_33335 [Streptomyces parvus]|uniref:hypothetical protein n=1 Tax=Streptomyces parvus TaxID=66428 RepID=UPI003438DF9D